MYRENFNKHNKSTRQTTHSISMYQFQPRHHEASHHISMVISSIVIISNISANSNSIVIPILNVIIPRSPPDPQTNRRIPANVPYARKTAQVLAMDALPLPNRDRPQASFGFGHSCFAPKTNTSSWKRPPCQTSARKPMRKTPHETHVSVTRRRMRTTDTTRLHHLLSFCARRRQL